VRAAGTIDPKSVEGLSALIASETAARGDVQVTSGADLRGLIGFDRERQLLGCTETSCMTEIAGSLGVEYLLFSEASKVGDVWLLSMTLLDSRKALAVSRITRRASSLNELVPLAGEALATVLEPVLGTAPGATAPAAPDGTVSAPSSSPTLAFAVGGAGLALAAGGAVFGVLALRAHERQQTAADAGDRAGYDAASAAVRRNRLLADGLYVAGGLAVATGLVLWLTHDPKPAPVALVPLPRGVAASF
jgi:hypothetical protein